MRRPAWAALAAAAFLAFLCKVAYELATGATFFVDSRAAGMVPLPLVHVVGAAAGLAAGFWPAHPARAGSSNFTVREPSGRGHTPAEAKPVRASNATA